MSSTSHENELKWIFQELLMNNANNSNSIIWIEMTRSLRLYSQSNGEMKYVQPETESFAKNRRYFRNRQDKEESKWNQLWIPNVNIKRTENRTQNVVMLKINNWKFCETLIFIMFLCKMKVLLMKRFNETNLKIKSNGGDTKYETNSNVCLILKCKQ